MGKGRDRLLAAAERILHSRGARQLSIDALVAEAGVSKGAFFHHWKTKDDFYAALMAAIVDELAAEVGDDHARDPDPVGSRQRAHLRASFQRSGPARARHRAFTNALLNATFETPDVVARIRAFRRAMFESWRDPELPVELQLLVDLAADGLWIHEALGTFTLGAAERAKVVALLVELTHGRKTAAAPRRRRAPKGKRKVRS